MTTNNSWNSDKPVIVADGGTGVASTTAYAVQCGGTTSTAPNQSIAGVGTAAQVLTSNGAGALPTFQAAGGGGGKVLQVLTDVYLLTGSGSTNIIPLDDTIPQNDEGEEILSVAITPASASNFLYIVASVNCSTSNLAGDSAAALFQDSTADALVAGICHEAMDAVIISYYMVAGTTSETTFKVRGGSVTSTFYFNSRVTSRIFGGVMACNLMVQEIEA